MRHRLTWTLEGPVTARTGWYVEGKDMLTRIAKKKLNGIEWQIEESHEPGWTDKARTRAQETTQKRTAARDADVWPRIKELRDQGLSLRRVAETLDSEGHTPPGVDTGHQIPLLATWSPVAVNRIIKRHS